LFLRFARRRTADADRNAASAFFIGNQRHGKAMEKRPQIKMAEH
jgi:hypothetical protein